MAFPAAWIAFRLVRARVWTGFGRAAYCKEVPSAWPSVTSHLNRYTSARPLAASATEVGRITQLNPAIGYESLPGSLVIEKLVGPTLVFCAAAAVAPATLACKQLPAAFLMYAWLMPVC